MADKKLSHDHTVVVTHKDGTSTVPQIAEGQSQRRAWVAVCTADGCDRIAVQHRGTTDDVAFVRFCSFHNRGQSSERSEKFRKNAIEKAAFRTAFESVSGGFASDGKYKVMTVTAKNTRLGIALGALSLVPGSGVAASGRGYVVRTDDPDAMVEALGDYARKMERA